MTRDSIREGLVELALRVEAAEGPDRELDVEIAPLQGLWVVEEGHPLGCCCYDTNGRTVVLPRYTASIDAAMSLVPEGCVWTVLTDYELPGRARIYGWPDTVTGLKPPLLRQSDAATPALALVAAALRAKAQS